MLSSGAKFPNRPDLATSRANLGRLYKSQYRYTEAEPRSLIQYADLVRARGRKSEADRLFNQALAIRRSAVKEIDVLFATNRDVLHTIASSGL